MKKILVVLLVGILILPAVAAINLNIEKLSENEVMIADLNKPATFDLKITNLGASDDFIFYSFFGSEMYPKGTVHINNGETKNVQVQIYPSEGAGKGFVTFEYFIRGNDKSEIVKKLTVKIIDLADAFEVGSGELDPQTNSLEVYIHNKVNFNFEQINATFSSPFFEFDESFSLGPNERKNFEVQLNKENFKKLMAGFYTLRVKMHVEDKEANVEGIIKFVEKNIVTTTKKEYGFILNTKIIKKVNEGNSLEYSETVIKKNIISRLFTSFNTEPDYVDRNGLSVYYTWNREVKPGETLEIIIRTNWLLPLLMILLIVVIVILVKKYSKRNIVLKKKVSFVRAKGGEFALKVTLFVHAKKYIENVNVTDRLPALVKIYERFGGDKPLRVNEKARTIEWHFEKLEAGEARILSYIIYSKVGVLGKFALPSATAIYEKEGKIRESQSNQAFFVAEQRSRDENE